MGSAPRTATAWDEPQELDSDNEAVITLYNGIRRILRQGKEGEPAPELPPPRQKKIKPDPTRKQGKHHLSCTKILNVKVERRLVTITIMKTSGEVVELQVQAAED